MAWRQRHDHLLAAVLALQQRKHLVAGRACGHLLDADGPPRQDDRQRRGRRVGLALLTGSPSSAREDFYRGNTAFPTSGNCLD